MKAKFNLLCSILALFCFISMYVPVIAPRYPAGDYYAPAGGFEREYFYTGDYYCAREYWDITRYVFSSTSIVGRIALSIAQALLLLWALMSVKGEARKNGVFIALVNLAVTAFCLIMMLRMSWGCRWGVLAMIGVISAMAVVMAVNNSSP